MEPHRVIGRYALFDAIAAGGMATVYYGSLIGPVGFTRTVAIKQLHPRFSRDPDFVSMFIDEARVTARIRHPNVVPVIDVVKHGRELYVVMEYVLGVSLAWLLRTARERGDRVPIDVVSGIMCGCLEGLHAAHQTRDEKGELLGIIHRDVSPGNVLVGRDGIARVLDFGIAKAVGRAQVTRTGEVKGKPSYMAPEQLRGGHVTRATDIHAVAVTLWEALVGTRAFSGPPLDVVRQRQRGKSIPQPSELDPELERFDALIARGLAFDPEDRWPTARAMAEALRDIEPPASADGIASWVEKEAAQMLDERGRRAAALEAGVSPTEIRAAIHADWNADTPMFPVEPESDGDDGRSASAPESLEELSGREVLSVQEPDPTRDETATRVEPSSAGARRPSAPAAEPETETATARRDDAETARRRDAEGATSDELETARRSHAEATGAEPREDEEATAAVRDLDTPVLPFETTETDPAPDETATVPKRSVTAEDEDSATWPAGGVTPPWQEPDSKRFARYGRGRSSRAMAALALGAIAAVLLVVLLLASGSAESTGPPAPPQRPSATREATATPSASPGASSAAATADSPEPAATAVEPDAEERTESDRRSPSSVAPRPRPRPPATPQPRADPPGSDDPFDELGGRH